MREKSNGSPAAKRARDGESRTGGPRERTLRSCKRKAVKGKYGRRMPDVIPAGICQNLCEKQNRWHHGYSRSSY